MNLKKKYRFPFTMAMMLSATSMFAGDVDPRFDGRWVGREIFQHRVNSANVRAVQVHEKFATIIGIADHAKTLGFTKGWASGRYEVVPEKSGGDKLEFRMPGTNGDKLIYVGRQHCTLKLSSDGNTIKESGVAIIEIDPRGHGYTADLWGTFHREGHY